MADDNDGWRIADLLLIAFAVLGVVSFAIGPILIVALLGYWIDGGNSDAFAICGSVAWTCLFLLCLWWSGS